MMERMDKGFNVEMTALTDVGNKRTDNQDTCICTPLWDDKHILAMVVDGVGGYAGGDVAARIAIEETVAYLNEFRDGERSRLMAEAFVHANNSIYRQRCSEDRLYRMCCVMTAALFDLEKGVLYMAHIGDTRLYAFSEGRIIKLSHDHSPVGKEEEAGYMTELEAMRNPYRNMLDKVAGDKELDYSTDFVETGKFPMGNGITWLFCSDGLSDMITSAQVSSILADENDLNEKARELVNAANEAGGKDNITVVLVSSTNNTDENTAQVMDEYARMVLPEHRKGDNPNDTDNLVLEPEKSMYPDDSEQTDIDTQNVSEHTEAKDSESEPETGTTKEIQNQDMEKDIYPSSHRPFPWKPFLLFIVTILLLGSMAFGYVSIKEWQENNQSPKDERESIGIEQLYYNINNL